MFKLIPKERIVCEPYNQESMDAFKKDFAKSKYVLVNTNSPGIEGYAIAKRGHWIRFMFWEIVDPIIYKIKKEL